MLGAEAAISALDHLAAVAKLAPALVGSAWTLFIIWFDRKVLLGKKGKDGAL